MMPSTTVGHGVRVLQALRRSPGSIRDIAENAGFRLGSEGIRTVEVEVALLVAWGFAQPVAAGQAVTYQLTETGRSTGAETDIASGRLDRGGSLRAVVTVLALTRDGWVSDGELLATARLSPWRWEGRTAARLAAACELLRAREVIEVRGSRDVLAGAMFWPSARVRRDYRLRIRANALLEMETQLLNGCRRTEEEDPETGAMLYTWTQRGQVVATGSLGLSGARVDFAAGFEVEADDARDLFRCGFLDNA